MEKCGYTDFLNLRQILRLSYFEKDITDINSSTTGNITQSAFTLYKQELLNGCLYSYNEKLDTVLKNVLIPKRIIEFTGHFQFLSPLCLQLCISIQLPKRYGGFESEAFYITTNGNFSIERLRELGHDFIEEYSKNTDEFNIESILNHIYYTKVNDVVQLIACLFELELLLAQKHIHLIVIDSISFHLRQMEISERLKAINTIFNILRYLAEKYNLIVILTNSYTTRINENEAYTVASFGDSFYHLVNSRVVFTNTDSGFKATLTKNIMYKQKEVYFKF